MAARLRQARQGLTTVVTTSSPLVLDQAELVLHLVAGRVASAGTHHELWHSDAAYRATLARATAAQDQEAGQ
jgi:ABC-type bacteriocin/lantibiotic exporter with double-glycine peptidase domain